MKTNLLLIPQTNCPLTNALREYEAAHAAWMDTPMHTEAGREVKRVKDAARAKYEAAYLAANPTHILL